MKHILKNTGRLIALYLFLAVTTACNEDLGNYDYKNINTVKIRDTGNDKGLNDHTCDLGETLKIEPILEFSAGEDESLFTYTWYYRTSNGWQVLQEGRNLNIEVATPIGTPDKTYSLAYEIVNKKNQIPYRKTFQLKVNNPLTRGFLALCEHDNGFDIDQIALSGDNRFNLYKNVLDISGSTLPRQGVKPYDVLCFKDDMAPNPYRASSVQYSVYILTDQYTTRILPGDYSWETSYDISNSIEGNSYLDKEYIQKGKPIVCQKMKVMYISANEVHFPRSMIYVKDNAENGNWYICTRFPMWLFYSYPMNDLRPNGGNRFEPAPFTAITNNGVMYFDMERKKFMYENLPAQQGSQYVFYSEPLPATEPEEGVFKFSDPNEGLLYMDEQDGTRGMPWATLCYAILKQADGSFKYIEFGNARSLGDLITTSNKKRASIFPASSGIGNAKFFARSPLANVPYLYYATNDNKVYKADISSASAVVEDITSSVIANDGYTEITAFKYTLPNSDDIGVSVRSLAIATFNSSLGKEAGGKLEFFRVENAASGKLSLAKYPETVSEGAYQIDMSWKGLGKIVGLSYKQK